MEITEKKILEAVEKNIISPEQGERLWEFWKEGKDCSSQFRFSHLAYYLGALLVLFALGWFMHNAWQWFGGMGMFAIAVVYAGVFVMLGNYLWEKGLSLPGGLLIVLAVAMTPLAIYGLERWMGLWPQFEPGQYHDFYQLIHRGYVWMEIGTILSAYIAIRFFPFPFLMAPIGIALYLLSIDVAPLLLGKEYHWQDGRWISLYFGAAMIISSLYIDLRCQRLRKEDYAFWGYLFGTASFWGGLTLMESGNEWSKFGYCIVNLLLLLFGVLIQRKVFLVFGTIGVSGYIGHLTYQLFKDSILFPFSLTLIGLLTIYGGIVYSRKQDAVEGWIRNRMPGWIQRFLPSRE